MAKLGTAIRPHEHDTEQQDFELLPNGIYRLEISASDVKQDDEGNTALNATIDVIEPEDYARRRFFVWIDTEHRDAEKQERGQKEIAKMARAMFGENAPSVIEDSEELHFHAFTARVKKGEAGVGKKSGKPYKARNSIQKYFYPDEGDVPAPAVDSDQPKAAAPATRQAANNNHPPAANNNKPAAAAERKLPWGKK